jgi:L-asparaginase II
MTKILTYVTRGKIVESVHESKCIIKDYNFKTIFSTNHAKDFIYPRSAIKIFQAIPFVYSKVHKKYNLTEKQIAISCSSHCGETEHLKVLESWIKKIQINKKLLQCGIHNPLNTKFSDKLLLSGVKPNQLHNNCSGKHLGMISGCLGYKMNLNNYITINHPYQKLIRKSLELFTECRINKIQKGIDGCNAPQYAFPLENLSIAMINLLKHFRENKKYSDEVNLLLKAIAKFPELTGSKTIYPSQLMSATNGAIFAKGGAEGVLLFAHKEKKNWWDY